MNEVSGGTTPTQRWESLGGHTGIQLKPITAVCGCIVSEPKKGKTTLFEGNQDAFIINLDGSSTVNPNCLATKWPPLNEDGTLAKAITWETVDKLVDQLVSLAQKNQDRPKCIVFDSLSSWLELVIDWSTRHAKDLGIVSQDKDDPAHFTSMNGQSAWEVVYSTITQTIQKLRNTGYGVWILGHIQNKNVVLANDALTIPELTITQGFWKRLHPRFDFIGMIHTKKVTIMKDAPLPGRPGQTKKVKDRDEFQRVLTIDYPQLKSVLGARVPVGDVELPLDEGWTRFAEAYEKARNQLILGVSNAQ